MQESQRTAFGKCLIRCRHTPLCRQPLGLQCRSTSRICHLLILDSNHRITKRPTAPTLRFAFLLCKESQRTAFEMPATLQAQLRCARYARSSCVGRSTSRTCHLLFRSNHRITMRPTAPALRFRFLAMQESQGRHLENACYVACRLRPAVCSSCVVDRTSDDRQEPVLFESSLRPCVSRVVEGMF